MARLICRIYQNYSSSNKRKQSAWLCFWSNCSFSSWLWILRCSKETRHGYCWNGVNLKKIFWIKIRKIHDFNFIHFVLQRLVFDRLMNRLGFNRYFVQGGDWGSIIGTAMATLFPHRFIYSFTTLFFKCCRYYYYFITIGSLGCMLICWLQSLLWAI